MMMCYSTIFPKFIFCVSNLLCHCFIAAIYVKLHAKDYVSRGISINLTCISDKSPDGLTAEFVVENGTDASLRRHNQRCYNGRTLCSPDICTCSADGKKYYLKTKQTGQGNKLSIECIMRFGSEEISDKITVHIIDLPTISIQVIGNCNGSSALAISCSIGVDTHVYVFAPWTHIVNSILIRNMIGDIRDNMSTLHIDPCSADDYGTYSCSVWSSFLDNSNKTSKQIFVEYEAPPLFDEAIAESFSDTLTVFSVRFYTLSRSISSHWYYYDDEIVNSSKSTVTKGTCTFALNIHSIQTNHLGYISNLTVTDNSPGRYTLVLKNRFGESRVPFHISENHTNNFNLQLIVIFLVVASVFIVTVVLTTSAMRCRQHAYFVNQYSRSALRSIYYAAPQGGDSEHTYNMSEPNYIEPSTDGDLSITPGYQEIAENDKDDTQYMYEDSHHYIEIV